MFYMRQAARFIPLRCDFHMASFVAAVSFIYCCNDVILITLVSTTIFGFRVIVVVVRRVVVVGNRRGSNETSAALRRRRVEVEVDRQVETHRKSS